MAPALLGQVIAPLLTANEPESEVVEVRVASYSEVHRGDVVCVLETTKATADVESAWDGYVGPLAVRVGDRIDAGEVVCEIFDGPPDRREQLPRPGSGERRQPDHPRLSRRAAKLARDAGVDLSLLPPGRIATEADVRALIDAAEEAATIDESVLAAVGERSLVVFGAGGHAKNLIDLVRSSTEYELLCVADDHPRTAEVLGAPVVNGTTLAALRKEGARYAVNAVGGIERMQTRIDVGQRLETLGFELPPLVERTAFVAASASLAGGAQVFAGAAVCSAAEVGRSAIVNTGAVVSHDCRIGAYAHVAPGALLAGEVEVGEATLVGMGATVTIGVRIGARSIVGNGAAVTADVPANTIVPVNTVWPADRAPGTRARRRSGEGDGA